MENNEIMNIEDIEMDTVACGEKSRLSTGAAMLIGAGVTLAVTAGVKLVKKAIVAAKAKKALRQAEEDLGDENVVDVVAE